MGRDSESRLLGGRLEGGGIHVARNNSHRLEETISFVRLQIGGGKGLIDEHPAAWLEHPGAITQAGGQIDVVEHIPAPDRVQSAVGQGHRFNAGLNDLD